MSEVSVYLAGSGDPEESKRVSEAAALINASDHLTLAHDWAAMIKQYGRNPRGASHEQRSTWAFGDIDHVLNALLFWLLIPQCPSVGAWVEYGAALASPGPNGGGHVIIASGYTGDAESIFLAAADKLFLAPGSMAILGGGRKTQPELIARADRNAFDWLEEYAFKRERR